MVRGNFGHPIFSDRRSKIRFLSLFGGAAKRFGCPVHAYCLMTNHFHALVQSGEQPLGVLMHLTELRFARYFNWRNDTTGHVFQNRYKSIICKDNRQLLTTLRYIHLNPVSAGLVQDPSDWPWSSHRAYLGASDRIVSVDHCLSLFQGLRPAREIYRSFMRAVAPASWPHKKKPRWVEPAD